jgi:REP element-mobilizing transposase RayT
VTDVPRHARDKSESGIYHIMLRGINKQDIFEDDEDRQRLLETIKHYKTISKYEIFGYCFMSNHVHILVKETEEPVSSAIKRICGSYAYWYNWKYNRCGHLFQERYKSEIVEDEDYFLTVLRYIHNNPVKAGISVNARDYRWSSYNEYMGKAVIADTDFALGIFSDDRKKAVEIFVEYTNEPNEDKCLEIEEMTRITDDEIRKHLAYMGISSMSDLQHLEKAKRHEIIRSVKTINGISVRQLSRVTGISKSVIDRA